MNEFISNVWKNGEVIVNDSKIDLNADELLKEGMRKITLPDGSVKVCRFDKITETPEEHKGHEYVMPPFSSEVLAFLQDAKNGKSFNILLTGASGTGKSKFVSCIAKMSEYGRIFQVNGRNDMSSTDFFGQRTAKIDPITKQNYICFEKGPLYQAFIEGTELDENGDQILYNEDGTVNMDGTGNPKVVGKPGIFFLDEFAAMDSSVFLSVFNQALIIPDIIGESRVFHISDDAGKVVKSHPSFVVFLAGNTTGSGTETQEQMAYTAQNNVMDKSTLKRITATYKFGYHKKAEYNIVINKLNDDRDADKLIRFVKEMRQLWKNGNVETLITTREIVQICNTAKLFRKFQKNYMTQAIYRCVFSMLQEHEVAGWNETIRMIFGTDLLVEQNKNNDDYFYAEKS